MKRNILKITAVVALLAVPAMAPAQSGGVAGWQGLAIRNDGGFGITSARDVATPEAARAEMLSYCARNGWSCEVLGVVQGCIAIAYYEPTFSYAATAADTRQAAVDRAYQDCDRFGYPCDNEMVVCPSASAGRR